MPERKEKNSAWPCVSSAIAAAAALFLYAFFWAEKNRDLGLWYYISRGSIRQYAALAYHCLPAAAVLVLAAGAYLLFIRKRLSARGRGILAAAVTALTAGAVIFAVCAAAPRMAEEREVLSLREQLTREGRIIHAAGGIHDAAGALCSYTNSRQALESSLAAGRRFIELDMAFTSDGHPVLTHEWEDLYLDGERTQGALSLTDFSRAKAAGKFDTLALDDVLDYMRSYPDLYVITDARGDTEEICGRIALARGGRELADRFIVQIYHEVQYDAVRSAGFRNIIYTLYDADPEEISPGRLRVMTREHNLVGITFWEDWTEDESFFDRGVLGLGVPLFAHTVNDPRRIAQLREKGISAVYTDLVN